MTQTNDDGISKDNRLEKWGMPPTDGNNRPLHGTDMPQLEDPDDEHGGPSEFQQLMDEVRSIAKSVVNLQMGQELMGKKFTEYHPLLQSGSTYTPPHNRANPSRPNNNRMNPNCIPIGYAPAKGMEDRGLEYDQPPPSPRRKVSCWRPNPRQPDAGNQESTTRFKFEPPRFDGSDPEDWIFKIEYYFDYLLTPEEDRLRYMVMLFDPPAAKWIRYFIANNNNVTWPEFLVAVRKRFDPAYYHNYFGMLGKLQQTGFVIEYQTAFEDLLERVAGIPEFALVSLFVSGLKQPIQGELNVRQPKTLAEAFGLAREYAARTTPLGTQTQSFQRSSWQPHEQRYSPPAMTAIPGPPVTTGTVTKQPPQRTTADPMIRLVPCIV